MKLVTMSIVCIGLAGIFFSCGDSKSPKIKITKTKVKIQSNSVIANRLMTAELEGVLEEKCKDKNVREELLNTKAVESCEFDFQSDRNINSVKVAFDKEKISADQIVEILNKMNDKQFKVGKVETQHYESSVLLDSEEHHSAEESNMNLESHSYETPNLLELFSRLVSG